jgi:hypothetical protein
MVVETRQAEYLVIEVELPGGEPEPAGVLLYDPSEDRAGIRMRRDWDEIAGEEAEVLELLETDMNARAAEMGGEALLAWMEDTLSNTVRVRGRRITVMAGDFDRTLARLYRQHVSATVRRFETHLPLVSLRAAAGSWGETIAVDQVGWVEAPESLRLNKEMFVAHVTGKSMEPLIPDGSLCVFRRGVVGSRQGKRVLVENLEESESGGQRYTVKRYTSSKRQNPDGTWEHERIILEPLNPDFDAWPLEEGSRVNVLAEFVCVLD